MQNPYIHQVKRAQLTERQKNAEEGEVRGITLKLSHCHSLGHGGKIL